MEKEVCRICLNSSVTLVDIFAKREQSDSSKPEPSLADMLNECANCYIDPNDGLPKQICLNCVLSAQSAFRFKQTCEQSYQQLIAKQEKTSPTSKDDLHDVSDFKAEQEIKVEASPSEEKLYKCPQCSKQFVHLSILSVHKKWHLENEPRKKTNGPKSKLTKITKNVKTCPTCKKKFKSAAALRKHMVSHTVERPFECTLCPQTFQVKSHLLRHMRGHTGECPYECPFCPEAFVRSDYCRSHMDKMHSGLTFAGKLIKSKKKTQLTK